MAGTAGGTGRAGPGVNSGERPAAPDAAAGTTTRIVLVRHAQAVCNVDETWAGHGTCRGLTARGRAQLPSIAARARAVCGSGAEVVLLCSRMRRAVETAEGLAAQLGLPGPPVRRCGLCERHPGSWDGLPVDQIGGRSGGADDPGGPERPEAFLLRARRELRAIAVEHAGKTVVAVTHGGVIGASFWVFGGITARLPFRLRAANGALTEWSRRDTAAGPWEAAGGWEAAGPWELERYNDGG